jgi:flavin reductase (DIM6/NTAB) family NADH-FMN oxidoreductase RutF
MTHGVYVVTCMAEGKVNGITVGCGIQASIRPPMVAIAINKVRHSHGLISNSGHFVFHVLADDQGDLSTHFGSFSGRNRDKFQGVRWEEGYHGLPTLPGCRAVMGCAKVKEVDADDHTLFIGQVETSHVDDSKRGLIFKRPDS